MSYEEFVVKPSFELDEEEETQEETQEEQPSAFDPEKLPEALLGKSPEEIGGLFNEMIAGQRALRERLQSLEQEPVESVEAPEPFTIEDLTENPESFNQKFERMLMAKAQPLVNHITELRAGMQGQQAVYRHPFLRKYMGEARQLLLHKTAAELADPRTWDTAAMQIKERHFDEIQAITRKPAPPDTNRPGNSAPSGGGKPKLTPHQKWIAEQMNLTHKEYLAGLGEASDG